VTMAITQDYIELQDRLRNIFLSVAHPDERYKIDDDEIVESCEQAATAIRALVAERNARLRKALDEVANCACYQEMPGIARAALGETK
jgi:hypothetical protein